MTIFRFRRIINFLKAVTSGTAFENHIWAVGGCVRDMLMEFGVIKDIDLVIDIRNGGIAFAEFLDKNNLLVSAPVTYERFGTAMFRLKEFPDDEIEVVHTRGEIYPDPNSRNPQQDFGDIREDSLRRDLTINALYLNITNNEIQDFTPAQTCREDISSLCLRTPRDPNETYFDDPLRMLRCIRFACRFDANIDGDTFEGIIANASRINIISKERVRSELKQILESPRWISGIKLLCASGLLKALGLGNTDLTKICDGSFSLLEEHIARENRFITAMMLLGADRSDLKALKCTREELAWFDAINNLQPLVGNAIIRARDVDFRMLLFAASRANIFDAVLIHAAKNDIDHARHIVLCSLIEKDIEGRSIIDIDTLPITGNDIMAICGIAPGKEVKSMLDLLTVVVLTKIDNVDDITHENCIDILDKIK